MPFVTKAEREGGALVAADVEVTSVVHADEATRWDLLTAKFATRRINRSEAYSLDGACNNWAESFFSRIRRAEAGIHHKIAGKFLSAYAREMAWREDFRRTSNGGQFVMIVGAAMAAPVSRQWKGYWQRNQA
ncbi:hypothetical protein CSW59_02645 [Caulobacter sp. BP25]|nr:hypothetical protein CSW59_02645 [Caulobacter sp. BP25]